MDDFKRNALSFIMAHHDDNPSKPGIALPLTVHGLSALHQPTCLIANHCWNISFDKPFDDPLMEPVPIAPHAIASEKTSPASEQLIRIMDKALNEIVSDEDHANAEEDFQGDQIVSTTVESQDTVTKKRKVDASENKQTTEKSSKKQRKQVSDMADAKLRPYQESQWHQQYLVLCNFYEQNGHCNVPHTRESTDDIIILARWVKRQRYQYKLMQQRMLSTMTQDRIDKLEEINFTWDLHTAVWEERFQELSEFQKEHGHCNVPSNFPKNPTLAAWVKCQRRQLKKKLLGNSSNITVDRIAALESLGFAWEIRGSRDSR